MARVSLSSQARRDLFSILATLSDAAGPRTARKYDTEFKRVVRRLTRFPGIGAPRPQLGAETRIVTVAPFVVFYDGGPKSRMIHVLRILHGRRNITPRLVARGREK